MKLSEIIMAYLSTPYSKYPRGVHGAYLDACKVAARLERAGVDYYCPIAETHGVAFHGGLDPKDSSYWLRRDLKRARWCDVLLMAEMEGWQNSSGMAEERSHFMAASKPVLNINPETLEIVKEWLP
jgi:hypothetical protein